MHHLSILPHSAGVEAEATLSLYKFASASLQSLRQTIRSVSLAVASTSNHQGALFVCLSGRVEKRPVTPARVSNTSHANCSSFPQESELAGLGGGELQ